MIKSKTVENKNYEKLAVNQAVYELAARGLCTSSEANKLKNFDKFCNWLADLTNSHGSKQRADYAFALYALNMWSNEVKEVDFKLEAQQVIYQLIKYSINIFTGK